MVVSLSSEYTLGTAAPSTTALIAHTLVHNVPLSDLGHQLPNHRRDLNCQPRTDPVLADFASLLVDVVFESVIASFCCRCSFFSCYSC